MKRETVMVTEPKVRVGKIKKKKKFRKLLKDAKRWKELKVLDEYLVELFFRAEHTPEFLEWLAWAKRQREAADPLADLMLDEESET